MKTLIKKLIPESVLNLYHKFMALLAAFWYANPSENMIVIGVTGTKGKSSTCNLIAKVLDSAGFKVGMTTTANFRIADKEWINDKKMTMLGRFDLQKLLKQMINAGCQYAVIETSSEGIKQFRHLGINYDIAVFTNLTEEHIESHGSFENYKNAKLELFKHLTKKKTKVLNHNKIEKQIIVNIDDPHVKDFLNNKADKKIGYKTINQSNQFDLDNLISASDVRLTAKGSDFSVDSHLFSLNLPGKFNVYNALAAISVAYSQQISFDEIKKGLEKVKGIPGRMEFINKGQNFKVIVDYAHEPASLEQVYLSLKNSNILHTESKIIHVLGSCGGGRDTSRRPVLGRIAAENADIVIITNEDPYNDDPAEIIEQVANGAAEHKVLNKNLYKILDRRQAIAKALVMVKENDVVLVTGKGSEQCIMSKAGEKIPWDDRKVVAEELEKLSKNK